MKCIIPCAGESSRMSCVPKHLIQIGGKPLIQYVIDAWKDHVDSFVFVLRRSAAYMWEYLPGNSAIVFQDEPKGLADAIMRTEPYIDDKFVLALGDCLHKGKFEEGRNFGIGVGVWKTTDLEEINKSYVVSVKQELITLVAEKPNIRTTDIAVPLYCGMGTYFLDRRVFDYIRNALPTLTVGGGDFTSVIQNMIDAGEKIKPVWFEGKYINITYPGDLAKAEEVLR